MTTKLTTGIAQNGKHYVEAEEGAFKTGDTVVSEGRFAAVTRKRRGGPAPHNGGTLVRTYKITGAGKPFVAMPDLSQPEPEMRQRFYAEIIDEQKAFDAE